MNSTKNGLMIRRDHPKLSIGQRCQLVNQSRSAFYNTPIGIDSDTLAMMKEISRRIIARTMGNDQKAQLVINAMNMAVTQRKPSP